ncbi:bifunctional 2-keto-4-hydroxyglutarate aldolase/2-keto-3-deoxy-6-phosphogluconate aldolase [Shouchella sp. 1P09AA]|uniref:bifunctional 2-keto-4-hydroxyglutarate aldolase/2-keto-3-deoxy-6-phosphogluconate aldolase n=1 Tax=unclassified Shouchella TaxID=2893065 RepID=UPI00399F100E
MGNSELASIEHCGIVAVVRADEKTKAIQIAKSCIKGGIHAIEVTFTIKGATQVIEALAETYQHQADIHIGAGSVLDAITARIAILAGATFIVSPQFNEEVAKLCNLYTIPYIPGCMTIKEMTTALECGVEAIKLFPSDLYQPSMIKAVKAPLPQVKIIPTGGIHLDNIGDWLKNGASAVGVGGKLIAPAEEGNYEEITRLAIQYTTKVKQVRGEG